MKYYDMLAAANPTLVKREVYGQSLLGTDLVAYKVTAGANTVADGAKPGVMFHGAQHAREWISAEVVRRGFQYFLEHSTDAASGIPAVLASTETWFIPVLNPDGYDYTFQTRAHAPVAQEPARQQQQRHDRVRRRHRHQPQLLREVALRQRGRVGHARRATPTAVRRRSPSPRCRRFHALMHRIKPEFYVDYHSYAKLVLYPIGWQVESYGGDTPLMEALAGTDQVPAVAGYDPDVGGELYTTNGEITDTMYLQENVMGYTVELDGGSGTPVGGTTTTGNAFGSNPSGFVFQDREADVQAVFAKNLPFMLDLAQSAPTPDNPSSHLGVTIPDFVPVTFPTSYGSPQTVEVNAKRSLGAVTLKWQIEGSPTVYSGTTDEFNGGSRYGKSGVVFHHMRGSVTGFKAGDKVKVWFEAGGKSSDPFTFTASARGPRQPRPRAVGRGLHAASRRTPRPFAGPAALATYTDALADAGIPADVYDIDAQGRTQADLLGILSHYKAVVWYTSLDDFVRDPGQTIGVSKMFDDQMISIRDYINEGGKVLVTGQRALSGAWSQYSYNPLGRVPDKPQCTSNTGDARPASSRTACRCPTTSCSTGWARTPRPRRRRRRPRWVR